MSARRTAAAFTVLVAAGAGALAGVWVWRETAPVPEPTYRCQASLDGATESLSAEQAANAALIAAVTAREGLPARAATIALATAMQESSLRNIDYGDRDSLGLFQQRPSQGWGTPEQIQDPYYSTKKFLDSLVLVEGWREMELTVAAQRVQRSAFPDAYARWEPLGRLWASALRGYSGSAALTCDVGPGPGTSAEAFAARIATDFGEDAYAVRLLSADDAGAWVDVTPTGGDRDVAADALAAWAVAVAADESVEEVVVGDVGWRRGEGRVAGEPGATVVDGGAVDGNTVDGGAEGVAVRLAAPVSDT